MAERRLRSVIFRLHAWLGLHIFLVLALIFLSGTLLVFIAELQAGLDSDRRLTTPVSVSARAGFGDIHDRIMEHDPRAQVRAIIRGDRAWIADKSEVTLAGTGRQFHLKIGACCLFGIGDVHLHDFASDLDGCGFRINRLV